MARRNLPDELLQEIFTHALFVPDDTFSSHRCASVLPGALDAPTSSILLVCKTWLRIATPQLYQVVILFTRGQAQALALALRSNPELGRFVKKLRVEGGYGKSMYHILQTTKALTDICVSLDLEEEDNTEGLCRGLRLISPFRLILVYRPAQYHAGVDARELVKVIVECIPRWNNLAVVEMPHDSPGSLVPHNKTVSKALKAATNLRILVLSSYERHLFIDGMIPQYISTIVLNPSLREIRPKGPPRRPLGTNFLQVVQRNARLSKLFDLRYFGLSPSEHFIYPMQLTADPKLEDVICDRVLFHLFQSINLGCKYLSHPGDDDAEPIPIISYLLVCRRFARLGTPYLYQNPHLKSVQSLHTFSRRLTKKPSLACHVRRLSVDLYGYYADPTHLEELLAQVPGLVAFKSYGRTLSFKVIEHLALHCGASLQNFAAPCITAMGETIDSSIFSRFPRMQSFTWDSNIAFSGVHVIDAFSQLKHLSITAAHPSLYTVMSQMRLPALRTVTLSADLLIPHRDPFFPQHGARLEELTVGSIHMVYNPDIFDLCPSLKLLTIVQSAHEGPETSGILDSCDPHSLLERIVFKQSGFKPGMESHLVEFLANFEHTLFPALREIEHPAFNWVARNKKQPSLELGERANDFMARNIRLVAQEGGRWRPRRQYVEETTGIAQRN